MMLGMRELFQIQSLVDPSLILRRFTLFHCNMACFHLKEVSAKCSWSLAHKYVKRKTGLLTDPEWKALLRCLRMRDITDNDIAMVRSLVLMPEKMKADNMVNPDWQDACLVTPWHSVRRHWNDAALRQWHQRSGHQIFVCTADDALSAKRKSVMGQIVPNQGENSERGMKTLPVTIQIAVGMKVMVTENVEIDLDIANGARGHITAISLHQDEPPIPQDAVERLRCLPAYILVRLDRTKASTLPRLDPGVTRLLRDFDESVLQQRHDLSLLAEDDWLDRLDETMRNTVFDNRTLTIVVCSYLCLLWLYLLN